MKKTKTKKRMKKTLLLVAIVAASGAQAGGFENARLDTAFMYEEGSSISLSSANKSYDVKGSTSATSKSVITDRSFTTLQAKYQFSDALSFGLTSYESGALHLNYQGAGGVLNAVGPKVNGAVDSLALLSLYRLNDNVSVTAGVRRDKISVQNADIFKSVGGSDPAIGSDSDITFLGAVAYEIPDIALRAELLLQSSSSFTMNSACGLPAPICGTDKSTGGMPEFMTLKLQTGIAPDTLAFASIHKGKWSKSQLSIADNTPTTATSSFADSTEYSVGLGRKISDRLSISGSYNWQPKDGSTTTSLFTVNSGYKGVSLGAKYALENIEFSLGYNYTKLGDVTTVAPSNQFKDNTVSAVGGKVTLRF